MSTKIDLKIGLDPVPDARDRAVFSKMVAAIETRTAHIPSRKIDAQIVAALRQTRAKMWGLPETATKSGVARKRER